MGHEHGQDSQASSGKLLGALLLNVGITVAQVVGGILSGSLSLLADAAHNASDAASLGVSYRARKISGRPADRLRTFGYNRAEVVGAVINLTALFVIAAFLSIQAARRLVDPTEVHGMTMLVVGGIAFVEDALSAWLLYRGAQESINVRSAFIHMLADSFATLGVLAGGALIMFYGLYWIDPAITAVIAAYIVVHGTIEIRSAIAILMESAPRGFDYDRMLETIESVDAVEEVHHVHLWRLDEHRVAMEAHVAIAERDLESIEWIKTRVKNMLRTEFNVEHATLEIEIAGRTGHDPSVISEGE